MKKEEIRSHFPFFKENPKSVYFDSAATMLKPQSVIDEVVNYLSKSSVNIHRSGFKLAEEVTRNFENVRELCSHFINAKRPEEIIFTKGTTDSMNILARMVEDKIQEGDEIVVSALEHHSNFVPWQQLAKRKKAIFKIIPLDREGNLTCENLEKSISQKTKLVALSHFSNVLGTLHDIESMAKIVKKQGALFVVDGAQSVAHIKIDVEKLGCDFFAFSGHKIFGPTGVGVLFGKIEHLEALPPSVFGGGMVSEVSDQETTWAALPFRFEAGTPPIAEVLGLGKAIEFLSEIGINEIISHEKELTSYAIKKMSEIKEVEIYGNIELKHGVIAFNLKGYHHQDLSLLLDKMNVLVRSGHHCAQPLMRHFKITGSLRLSLAIYNTIEEVDLFVTSLKKSMEFLK